MNFLTEMHEFHDIVLFEASETFVYQFRYGSDIFYCETVANPTARELTDAILNTIKEN